MIDGITPLHLVIVLVIALIIIGPGKLPSVGKALGETIREFRGATGEIKQGISLEPRPANAPAPMLAATATPTLAAVPATVPQPVIAPNGPEPVAVSATAVEDEPSTTPPEPTAAVDPG